IRSTGSTSRSSIVSTPLRLVLKVRTVRNDTIFALRKVGIISTRGWYSMLGWGIFRNLPLAALLLVDSVSLHDSMVATGLTPTITTNGPIALVSRFTAGTRIIQR